ncbi:MAG: lipoprotein release ABC transporter permease, partial [Candidatus Berkelbacteria bacterium Athens1014_28]
KIIDFKSFVNYYLIKSDNMDLTKENLEKAFPNLEIMSKQQFLDNNTEIITDTFLPIIEVLLIIAVVIGIAVIGLTIYTATIEKSQEYGVLKAIGYSNLQLFSIALIQSLVAGIIGLIAGSILTILVVNLATYVTSAFIFELGFPEMMAVISMALGMSIVAAFIPLRRLLSIDPANVFKV